MKKNFWLVPVALIWLLVLSCSQVQEYKEEEKKPVQAAAPAIAQGDSSIVRLEQLFGGVSHDGAGSSVYRIGTEDERSIDSIAWGHFTEYLGSKYSPESASRWKKGWGKVYVRKVHPDSSRNINTELNMHKDPRVRSSVPLLLEFVEPVVKARQALAAVYNRKDIKELSIYVIGDGEAYSGLLIAGRYKDGTGCTLIAMAD
ncbi:MAG: hypothetical protein WBP58_14730 [Chitinophagaceae bacterium]